VKQSNKNLFKGRQFTAEIILWAGRWYLQFPISYRDLERMFSDRGIQVDHTTLFRGIHAYAPELEKHASPSSYDHRLLAGG
jgi:transposase-like protein